MKKSNGRLAITMVSLFLGIILAVQFKTVNKTLGEGVLPTQRAQQLAIELKKAQEERDAALKALSELEEKIKLYEKGEAESNVYAENLYKDLERYRTLAGYVDLEGPGIVLEIQDPPVDLQFGIEYTIADDVDLILQIISVLNAAEAEAISINDQRYTSFTEIEKAGNHIEINGVSIGSPIIIKAIGDPETLESALAIKGGIIWTLEYYDYNVHLTKEKNVQVPKYRKLKEFIYAKPVEQDSN
ncbi:uncharacterized protein YlxW (UPF0749 family) [Keratinibaculum paraultunense]|uniref:Uncharacterized protein YlxW (UPF0749 family) n=1 Tax=Keratinibaculum paraultunense TaxID=1278232 RepID=A0A4V2UUK3_9FIRM|nr:DUF881 domain-containing protein [Keratinibaculum paraultunense]QQY80541.1 DUF881 domain-containing protein [Keratinibaculum paraultunense]TCS91264.1 uncharacterized protein YlxW (UPF0749 family) [Keratinibaculum paraultunense]